MVVMAVVPIVPVLADLVQSTPVLALSNIAVGGISIVAIILIILAAIPIGLIIGSIPLWLAAKMAVSTNTTFGTALKVRVCNILAFLLISFAVRLMAMVGGLMGSRSGANTVDSIVIILGAIVGIFIIANCYEIGALHAFGVQILSGVIAIVFAILIILGFVVAIGGANVKGSLLASLEKFKQARNSTSLPSSSPSQSSPPISQPAPAFPSQPDYSAEIDGLLNAAMHPTGPKLSLTEREDVVRTLQQRLQAQRSNISAGDARAITVYQNQFNRYLLLLNEVKAERKAHPLGEASPQAAR